MPNDSKTPNVLCSQCGKPLANGSMPCANCEAYNELGGVQTLSMDPRPNSPQLKDAEQDGLLGRRIAEEYDIVERLGEGAMGAVYRAKRVKGLADVAIKFLHKRLVSDSAALQRFIQEARLAGSIEHPNVVKVWDWTTIEDETVPTFIVMELVTGRTLASIIKEEPLAVNRAVSLMVDICKGVGAAHGEGIIHRDMKPANVMICIDRGREERVKVLDFGLAKLYGKPDRSRITETGFVVGTPFYMSPEQYRGDELDARSDVYSLAAVVYEMLTGAVPFQGKTPDSIRGKHEKGPREFADQLGIPRKLSDVVLGALSVNPNMRPADANEFGDALREAMIATGPIPRPPIPIPRPQRFDFGIISGDSEAIPALRDALGLHSPLQLNHLGPNLYYWGAVETREGRLASVALGTPTGRRAHVVDGEAVRNMIDICDPEFILVLGAARGLKTAGTQLGQVVYSRLVRAASSPSFSRNDFTEAGNLPPDERLFSLANVTATEDEWRQVLKTKRRTIKPPNAKFHPPKALCTEVFSTANAHDEYSSQVFQTIRSLYPKVAAVETEGGSVASTLLGMFEGGRSIGYLVIKGIADLVDEESSPEERKKRQSWVYYASYESATFAQSLIKLWRPGERRVPKIPVSYLEILNRADHNKHAHVFHGFDPEKYSDLCRAVCSNPDGTKRVFAVCEFEPSYFIEKISRDSNHSPDELMNLDDATFMRYANGVFPHFEAFRVASERGVNVSRVVLARDSYSEWRHRNTDLNIRLFIKLNGSVSCYLAESPILRSQNLKHITDHVIFNSNLMLDYYDDSQTLIMTYDQDGLEGERVKFERHFDEHKQLWGLYRPADKWLVSQ
jgi:serine/threonine protein kinase